MLTTKTYAAPSATEPLKPHSIQRRDPGPNDILIDIRYCGVCHSDLHTVRNEWGNAIYPLVPGHEIAGVVTSTGANVKRFKAGDKVGVGCFVDSCRDCKECHDGVEQYCGHGLVFTYSAYEKDGKTPTYGGYSTQIVVDQNYVFRMPANLPLDQAAPLLCAGITTYSPLRHWKAGKGTRLAVIGLGGLGHMAVKFGKALGSEVTVLSQSLRKQEDGKRLGASHFYATSNEETFKKLAGSFDLIINTVSAVEDWNKYLNLLDRDGTMVVVGAPPQPSQVSAFSLIMKRRSVAGSLIGGIPETQEMLDFCGTHNITCDIEKIQIQEINEAYERMLKGDVRYRFVIDIESLKK